MLRYLVVPTTLVGLSLVKFCTEPVLKKFADQALVLDHIYSRNTLEPCENDYFWHIDKV